MNTLRENRSKDHLYMRNDLSLLEVKYSKFSHSLDKIFKGKSIKDIEQKKAQKSVISKKSNDDFLYIKKIKRNKILPLLDQNSTEIFANSKSSFKKKVKSRNKKNNKLRDIAKSTIETFNFPYPGKYNPNYSAIDKNIPCFIMRKNIFQSIEKLEKKSSFVKIQIINKTHKKIAKNDLNTKLVVSNSQENLNFSENNYNLIKNHYKEINNKKNFKGINFEDYSWRKDNSKTFLKGGMTYLESKEKEKKFLDFKKMISREKLNIHYTNSPSVCSYNPLYKCLDKKVISIPIFEKRKNNNSSKNKNFILHKILKNYDTVTSQYQTVKLE